jgi:hypothetical protein
MILDCHVVYEVIANNVRDKAVSLGGCTISWPDSGAVFCSSLKLVRELALGEYSKYLDA